jgi:hypothetical protein
MACQHNTGTIGEGSCNAPYACRYNTGSIPAGVCNTSSSCVNGYTP